MRGYCYLGTSRRFRWVRQSKAELGMKLRTTSRNLLVLRGDMGL